MTDIAKVQPEKAPIASRNVVGERCLIPGADAQRVQQGQAFLLDEAVYFNVAETFRVLADSTRAKIVYSLLRQELCTCDLAAIIGVSESAVSQHLRVLRQLRLVKSKRAGKLVFYSLDDSHIRVLLSVCLRHVRDGAGQDAELDKVIELFAESR